MKGHLPICREFCTLCIEDWVVVDYTVWLWTGRGFEDLAFWWVVCLDHLRYCEICLKDDNDFVWPGFTCGLVSLVLVACGDMGRTG